MFFLFKSHNKQSSPEKAYILLLVLSCLSILSSLLISISLVESTNNRIHDTLLKNKQAQNNARFALKLAIANLQKHTGSDAVITLDSELLKDNSPTFAALAWNPHIEDFIELQINNNSSRKVCLLNQSTTGSQSDKIVSPIQKIENIFNITNEDGYAYWIIDEGYKASLLINSKASKEAQRQTRVTCSLDTIHTELSKLAAYENKLTDRTQVSLIIDKLNTLTDGNKTQLKEEVNKAFHYCNYSTLSSTHYEQLKYNLTEKIPYNNPTQSSGSQSFDDFFNTGYELNKTDSIPFIGSSISTVSKQKAYTHYAPIITEFFLYMGIFHAQSDNYLRLRYHIGIELWNPYPFPLQLKEATGSRSYILLIQNLPKLCIQNLNKTEMKLIVDLNDFENFSDVRNTINNSPSKNQLHAWIEVKDKENSHLNGVLLPGETIHLIEPQSSDNGLSRILNNHANRWYLNREHEGSKSFSSNDRFEITSLENTNIELKLLPYTGSGIAKGQLPKDYAKEHPSIIEIKNIPFDKISYNCLASDTFTAFSIAKSRDYTIDRYNFGSYFRLKSHLFDPDKPLFQDFDPREAIIDFSISDHKNAFEVIEDPVEAFYLKDSCFQSIEDNFHASKSNARTYINQLPKYHPAIAFEFPTKEPLNVSIFKNLLINEKSSLAMGRSTDKASPLNVLYENSYFSGKQSTEIHPRLHFLNLSNNIPKNKDTLIKGSFNLHSSSVIAWESILRNALNDIRVAKVNPFYTFPNTTDEINGLNLNHNLAYPNLNSLQKSDLGLTNEQIKTLSKNIVRRLKEKVRSTGPYKSLEDFCNYEIENNCNLLDCAIRDTRNELPLSNEFHAGTIMNSIASFLTVRSDTFTIRSYGEVYNQHTQKIEAKAYCEATVQRFPDFIDSSNLATTPLSLCSDTNKKLGRRYRIIGFKWLKKDEI